MPLIFTCIYRSFSSPVSTDGRPPEAKRVSIGNKHPLKGQLRIGKVPHVQMCAAELLLYIVWSHPVGWGLREFETDVALRVSPIRPALTKEHKGVSQMCDRSNSGSMHNWGRLGGGNKRMMRELEPWAFSQRFSLTFLHHRRHLINRPP